MKKLVLISLVFASFLVWNQFAESVDRQEGWIIQETEQGLVKVPRKQYFSFEGYDVNGEAYTPSQGILDQRPLRRNRSLIPERRSFKRESLNSSGYMKK